MAFLFVMMTPEDGLGLLENAVRSCLGGQWFGLRTTLPMYVAERIATRLCASGKLKNIFLILVFLMCSSLTWWRWFSLARHGERCHNCRDRIRDGWVASLPIACVIGFSNVLD